jgi:hypothetical protein
MSEPVKTLCFVEILGVSAAPFSKYSTKNLETKTAIKRKKRDSRCALTIERGVPDDQ